MRPSAFCAVSRLSRRKASSPPSVPPVSMASGNAAVPPLARVMPTVMREASSPDCIVARPYDWAPTTTAWPLPTKTLRLPSDSVRVVTRTCWLSWAISWSRWSSRSLAGWPGPAACARMMRWFSAAICVV